MTVNEMMMLIKQARSEYDGLVGASEDALRRLHAIGVLCNKAVGLNMVATLADGKSVKVKSANAFSVAAGIPQSSVSRGVRLVAKFPSVKAAIAAYRESSFQSTTDFITSLSGDKKPDATPTAVVKVRFDKGAKVEDLAAVLKATLTPAQLKALRSRI